jgi:hypothetical protein
MASNARRAGNSSESVAGQRFSAARQSFSKRRRSLSASPPRQSSETRQVSEQPTLNQRVASLSPAAPHKNI